MKLFACRVVKKLFSHFSMIQSVSVGSTVNLLVRYSSDTSVAVIYEILSHHSETVAS